MPYYPPRSALAIGTTVVGGTPERALYIDGSGLLGENANYNFNDGGSGELRLTGGAGLASDYGTFGDGTAAVPSVRFNNASTTGFYRDAANTIGIATNGARRGTINALGDFTLDTGGTFRWPDGAAATPACRNSNEASGMFRRAAGELNFSRAGTEVMRVSANGWQLRQGRWSNGVAGNEVATVGAAGAAAALPAQPLGYLQFLISTGATVNIPYYTP